MGVARSGRPVSGPLTARVRELCSAAAGHEDEALAAKAKVVDATLAEPLRLAVAGRVSSGKSTLVNALLRRRVAPTKPTECTQLVTWYRQGTLEKVDVHLRDHSTRTVRLDPDGRLPQTFGVPVESVERLEVHLPEAVLDDLVLIDTPGLASLTAANSARSESLLGIDRATADSVDAAERAEAVLFVFAASLKADERGALRDFQNVSASVAHSSPVNALGVLTKADTLTEATDDPWPSAERLAADFASKLVHEVATVVPVAGLLAETAEAGALTEADAAAIAGLAELPDKDLGRLLLSVDAFVSRPAAVDERARAGLAERLDLYGVRLAVDLVRGGASGAVALKASLAETSRIGEIRSAVKTTFARRADVLKASYGLGRLAPLAYDGEVSPSARAWIGDRVEALRLHPALHAIVELEALHDLVTGKALLPPDLAAAFRALVDGATPGERIGLGPGATPEQVAREARGLADACAAFAFDAAPVDARVARVAARSAHLLVTPEGTRVP